MKRTHILEQNSQILLSRSDGKLGNEDRRVFTIPVEKGTKVNSGQRKALERDCSLKD